VSRTNEIYAQIFSVVVVPASVARGVDGAARRKKREKIREDFSPGF
jgi:hypothetical protein